MGRPTPLLRIHELVALSFISSAAVFSQVASNDVEKLVVVIHVAHPEQQGTGLIVGEIKKSPSEINATRPQQPWFHRQTAFHKALIFRSSEGSGFEVRDH